MWGSSTGSQEDRPGTRSRTLASPKTGRSQLETVRSETLQRTFRSLRGYCDSSRNRVWCCSFGAFSSSAPLGCCSLLETCQNPGSQYLRVEHDLEEQWYDYRHPGSCV